MGDIRRDNLVTGAGAKRRLDGCYLGFWKIMVTLIVEGPRDRLVNHIPSNTLTMILVFKRVKKRLTLLFYATGASIYYKERK